MDSLVIMLKTESVSCGMHCKFAPICRYYDEEATVCNREEEACEYCGTYSEFEAIIELKKRYPSQPIVP
jgi:hypothetical protein